MKGDRDGAQARLAAVAAYIVDPDVAIHAAVARLGAFLPESGAQLASIAHGAVASRAKTGGISILAWLWAGSAIFDALTLRYGPFAVAIVLVFWAWIVALLTRFAGELAGHVQQIFLHGRGAEEVGRRHAARSLSGASRQATPARAASRRPEQCYSQVRFSRTRPPASPPPRRPRAAARPAARE